MQKGKEAPKFFWTFLASCKLYNNRGFPSKDILNDQNSTDFNLLYHTADGGEINDKKSHNMWKKALEESRGHHVGSLRLHIILPHICSRKQPMCYVQGNDVIIYIDKSNIANIFDNESIDLLALATNTNKEGWMHG